MKKVAIELTPFEALEIITFLRQGDYDHPKLAALATAVNSYEKEIYKKVTDEQVDDATAERKVNQLLDKSP